MTRFMVLQNVLEYQTSVDSGICWWTQGLPTKRLAAFCFFPKPHLAFRRVILPSKPGSEVSTTVRHWVEGSVSEAFNMLDHQREGWILIVAMSGWKQASQAGIWTTYTWIPCILSHAGTFKKKKTFSVYFHCIYQRTWGWPKASLHLSHFLETGCWCVTIAWFPFSQHVDWNSANQSTSSANFRSIYQRAWLPHISADQSPAVVPGGHNICDWSLRKRPTGDSLILMGASLQMWPELNWIELQVLMSASIFPMSK